MKIALIINYITHYRTSFYQKLCQSSKDEWTILHGQNDPDMGRPYYTGDIEFSNQLVGYHERLIGPFTVRYQDKVIRVINKIMPDAVIVMGIPGTISNWTVLLWAKLNRKKSAIWYCGWEAQQGRGIALLIKQLMLRLFFSISDHIITYGTKAARYANELGVQENKITVCYNGIEIDGLDQKETDYTIAATELRKQRNIVNQHIFLYVGGLMEEKNVDIMIKAFGEIKKKHPAELWVIGNGPDEGRLVKLVNTLKIQDVYFMGRIVEKVETYFKAADTLILPGTGGLVLNQALYWGLPCVVGEADGTEDDLVIDGKTGFRFQPGNINSLILAMEKSLSLNRQQRIEFVEAGKKLVIERSNVNQMVETFWNVVDKFRENN